MSRLYKLILLIPLLIIGCKSNIRNNTNIIQTINSLNMNIFSIDGKKLLSIKSPHSNFDKKQNIYNLRETTIIFFEDNESKYLITSDNSKLSNNNKLIELNGNVLVKTLLKEDEKLYSNSFRWNIENAELILVGNVNFKNNSIFLSSNKAILNKNTNIIEFYNPVKYRVYTASNENKYEVNSQNAFYNIKTKSVIFRSKGNKVRSKIYF